MREPVEALSCDEVNCDTQLREPRSSLTARAQEQGWQVDVVRTYVHHGDSLTETRTDRCPKHRILPAR